METALKFLQRKNDECNGQIGDNAYYTTEMIKEFARGHVEAALQAAAEMVEMKESNNDWEIEDQMGTCWAIDKDKILTAYPISNIE